MLPDKFMVGCIIAKQTQTWIYFATSLKQKRQEFSVIDLIVSLDVEKGESKICSQQESC